MLLFEVTIFLGFIASVHAHFLLSHPQTRGFDEDKEITICSGFPVAKDRSQFPLGGGIVSITSEHPQAEVNILISFEQNPTSFGNFNKTASGHNIPMLMNFIAMNAQGDACFPVNVSSLDVPEAQNGANATIQVEFRGPDGLLFQCSDVVLSNTFTVPNGTKCDNATGAFPSTGPSASSGSASPTSPTAGPSPSSGSSGASLGSSKDAVTAFSAACATGILGVLLALAL